MAKKPKIGGLLDDVAENVIKPEPQGIRAYHGSPHDFDRFDMSKIGTGEGAQAYGHGLYFADSEGVAKSYRDALATKPIDNINNAISAAHAFSGPNNLTGEKMRDWMVREGFPSANITDEIINYALQAARGQGQDGTISSSALEAYRKIDALLGGKGHMYEVNIRANPKDFLDWDKSLREQPEAVRRLAGWSKDADAEYQAALGRQVDDIYAALTGDSTGSIGKLPPRPQGAAPMDWTGAQFYESSKLVPGDYRDKIAATERLREAGVPGIKYLDAGSRAAGDGSRNYVVFDDNLIDIIRKYGIVPGGLLGAGYAMSPSDAEAAPKVPRPRLHGPSLTDAIDTALPSQTSQLSQARPDWIGENGSITANPPWLRPDPNERSTLGKMYDAVTTNPLGTVKAVGGALGDAVKNYAKSVYANPSKGAADALELGVTAYGGAIPQAFWMATSPDEANGGEEAILADRRRKMMQGLLAD